MSWVLSGILLLTILLNLATGELLRRVTSVRRRFLINAGFIEVIGSIKWKDLVLNSERY